MKDGSKSVGIGVLPQYQDQYCKASRLRLPRESVIKFIRPVGTNSVDISTSLTCLFVKNEEILLCLQYLKVGGHEAT